MNVGIRDFDPCVLHFLLICLWYGLPHTDDFFTSCGVAIDSFEKSEKQLIDSVIVHPLCDIDQGYGERNREQQQTETTG